MSDIDDAVADIVGEAALEPMAESVREGAAGKRGQRDNWIAIASSLLAVLSAVSALFASFASDRVQDAMNQAAIAANQRAVSLSERAMLSLQAEVLRAANQPLPARLNTDLAAATDKAGDADEALEAARHRADALDGYHDALAIAVTLFQIAIVLGSLAVLAGSNAALAVAALAAGAGLVSMLRALLLG
jgi:hypothetical protein